MSEQTRLAAMLVLPFAIFIACASAQDSARTAWTDDQASVIGCLTINTAELTYANTYKNGFSSNLKALAAPDEGANYTASAAGLFDASLGGAKRNGYVFTYKAAPPDDQGKISGYTVSREAYQMAEGYPEFFHRSDRHGPFDCGKSACDCQRSGHRQVRAREVDGHGAATRIANTAALLLTDKC